MLNKIKFLFIALITISITININAQNISVKGGVGFYSFYKSEFGFGRVYMSPTPTAALSLGWQLSDLFSLSWVNAFRFKLLRADFIGIDTVSYKDGIGFYRDFSYFNIDSKVMGIFSLMRYDEGDIYVVIGTGITLPLNYESGSASINNNVVLRKEYYEMRPQADVPIIFSNTGILTEFGMGINYKKVSLTTDILIELFKVEFFDVGKVKTSLIQVNIGYNF